MSEERCRIVERETGSPRKLAFDLECGGRRVGYITAHKANKKVGGRVVFAVGEVVVAEEYQRRGFATRLYESAAAEACRRRSTLASVERHPGAHSTDFWEKQVRKGRARRLRGDRFLLTSCELPIDLGRADAPPRPLVSPERAVERVEERHPGTPLARLPKHIEPFGRYMRLAAEEPITARRLVKAYVMTRASVQRQGVPKGTVCRVYPGYTPLPRHADTAMVRPEDVMARLFFTPAGERYLDAAERGGFDAEAARELADRMHCFGLIDNAQGLYEDMRRAAEDVAPRTPEYERALSAAPQDYWAFMKSNAFGIGASKAGFFAALLGRGDIPTFDAREIELWSRYANTRKALKRKVRWEDVVKLRERLLAVPMQLPRELEPYRVHLVHHALWDAYAKGARPSKTSHGALIRAMQFAGANAGETS